MKETKRKAFNFYRSYYDVFNRLPNDKDKLAFISALLDKQFLDVEPSELSLIVDLVWTAQYDSIDQQVKGYKHKTNDPMQGGRQGGRVTPAVQEKEKEKVEYTIPEFEDFKAYALTKKPKVSLSHLRLKYDSWIENGWKNGNGKQIKNWKSSLLNTLQYIEEVTQNGSNDYASNVMRQIQDK